MRLVSILLALILFFSPVVWAKEEGPLVAVFVDYTLQFNYSDNVHNTEIFWVAKDWSTFDQFLLEAKKRAGARKVVFDIAVHGIPVVFVLSAGNEKKGYLATTAGLLNHIDSVVGAQNVECVCLEACYAGFCYYSSVHPDRFMVRPLARRAMLEGRSAPSPLYPVYGLPSSRNIPPNVLEQYLHKQFLTIEDLRQYEYKCPPNLSAQTEEIAVLLNRMILARLLFQMDKVER